MKIITFSETISSVVKFLKFKENVELRRIMKHRDRDSWGTRRRCCNDNNCTAIKEVVEISGVKRLNSSCSCDGRTNPTKINLLSKVSIGIVSIFLIISINPSYGQGFQFSYPQFSKERNLIIYEVLLKILSTFQPFPCHSHPGDSTMRDSCTLHPLQPMAPQSTPH